MMQGAHNGDRLNATGTLRANRLVCQSLRHRLSDALVRTVPVKVCDVLAEDPTQMPLVQDKHVVKALPPEAA
jgi:hypothetical protein